MAMAPASATGSVPDKMKDLSSDDSFECDGDGLVSALEKGDAAPDSSMADHGNSLYGNDGEASAESDAEASADSDDEEAKKWVREWNARYEASCCGMPPHGWVLTILAVGYSLLHGYAVYKGYIDVPDRKYAVY